MILFLFRLNQFRSFFGAFKYRVILGISTANADQKPMFVAITNNQVVLLLVPSYVRMFVPLSAAIPEIWKKIQIDIKIIDGAAMTAKRSTAFIPKDAWII
ncbi:Uncharacterised protein [Chlamydia trachomatis]|nr:Uncharacterised protein [Chlamydia trachomatis]